MPLSFLACILYLSLWVAFREEKGRESAPVAKRWGRCGWTCVSVDTVRPDGSRTPMYGPHPHGLVIFDGHGHYALVNSRSDLPKYVSNDRMKGSAEEYRAVVQGSIAHFGTYVVNEADKTITFHIDASTFPNWNGVEQRRPFVLSGDELRWTTPAASGGGSGEVVLRRAK
ncbi:lipocalin-like domain-containing protein [Burkholderia ambifaria]|uniref:lipocalin-like domain-containing protein n=1 Tax=Burkholderia ambifaria TaxID=152480 RepID=UPI00312CAE6D